MRINAVLLSLMVLLFAAPGSYAASSADDLLRAGEEAYRQGDYRESVSYFDRYLADSVSGAGRFDALLYRGDALRILGYANQAYASLRQARTQLDKPGVEAGIRQEILLRSRLGVLELARGRVAKAVAYLEEAAALVAGYEDDLLKAAIFTDLGLAYSVSGRYDLALEQLDTAERVYRSSGDRFAITDNSLNRLKVRVDAGNIPDAMRLQAETGGHIEKLPAGRARADKQIALATMTTRMVTEFELDAKYRLKAYELYKAALATSDSENHDAGKSYALGGIGHLYELEGRYEQAVGYSRRAVFYAQSLDIPELLYQWEWQLARNLRALGDVEGALQAYGQAIVTLKAVRPNLESVTRNAYRDYVGPVLYQYTDVLLRQAVRIPDGADKQAMLTQVRDTLEEVKLAEVSDYFESQCLPLREAGKSLDEVGERTAVVYPVLLQDRTELLVSFPGGLKQYTSTVDRNTLTQLVREFRLNIESDLGTRDYLRLSERLYDAIIGPIEKELEQQQVETLVMVPDGPLRTIPLAALFDGERYLVEKYAIATTPGLTLTEPRPLGDVDITVLAAGITESVQGFSALPSVGEELSMISEKTGATVYKDETFKVDTVRRTMEKGDFVVAHFATHGEFSSNYRDSFILAHDGKLTMELLSETISVGQIQLEPIEMLVLSACQTAAGDDRAALGLAGVAVKAGARSALATLWSISDEATAVLITDFYDGLLSADKLSRADSLRNAQVSLLQQPGYSHPTYWAPFLLIGNWL